MLLTGTFIRSLDDKLRLAIPKRLRDALGHPEVNVLYLAPGTDCSLALYTEAAFQRLADQIGQNSPVAQDVRAFSRLFYARAEQVEVDRQGRLRLPAELARLASITKEIVLLGVRDHLEIWDLDSWRRYQDEMQPHYDTIAESAFAVGMRSPMGPMSPPPVNMAEGSSDDRVGSFRPR
ncbi:MAG: division/cell wall cluster transcriptional repressor MraZ [Pirellulaceae bacterium]|nr:division/cell wall cluster transcriptional repressor MraZ [Planctomycetales bacterium]MCA9206660.1 division/cell wall cluster transcriptional repressor MraZ [Planctomycetales bacterium]MCA9227047.1 division/cell wall cluster transcriptional repressor MraZ [Planctomycetales bacterium]